MHDPAIAGVAVPWIQEGDTEARVHHVPEGYSDRLALGFTRLLRIVADNFFAQRYGHRAICSTGVFQRLGRHSHRPVKGDDEKEHPKRMRR